MAFEVFVSYSHEDEWLKNELLQHLSALQRGGHISTWHDRRIVPGAVVDKKIREKLLSSEVVLFLVSPSFIQSDYCMETEYRLAQERHKNGEAQIVPIIVRECDWDVYGLRDYLALPTDAEAVTKGAVSKGDAQARDGQWLDVVRGLKTVIAELKKNLTPPELLANYAADLFMVDFVRHPNLSEFDESKFWVDPELYFEKQKQQINQFSTLKMVVKSASAVVVSGTDRSGKSLIAKRIQNEFCSDGEMVVLISGKGIKNADIGSLVSRQIIRQFGSDNYPHAKITVVIDDFDSCTLTDSTKEKIIRELSGKFARTVLFSFSSAATVLYAPDDLPEPISLDLLP